MNLWESFKELPFWSQLTIGGATLAGAFMVIGEMRNNHLIQQSAESFDAELIGKKGKGKQFLRVSDLKKALRKSKDTDKVIAGDLYDENVYLTTKVFKDGNEVAIVGEDGWHYYDDHMDDWRTMNAESFEAPLFSPSDDDDEERDFNPHESYNCHVCDRPYEFSKIARSLAQHYLKESDGGEREWYHSKSNPEGIRKTARNIAGYELYYYGMQALEHYMAKSKPSKLRETVIELLRKATVPNIIVGDVVQFIETLEIDGVDDLDPKFSKEFSHGMAAESKCACGCSIGKCECDEGCKCGCNHKKGGAKWANPTKKN